MAKRKSATRKRHQRRIFINVGKTKRAEIREYSKFIPSLEKLKGKTKITPAEQAQLSRAKRLLRHTDNLKPVTEKQAKQLKKMGLLEGKGVRAIRLRNTEPHAKISVLKSGIIVTSNGRKWEYHPVAPDIEALATHGETLLNRDDVAQINLWTNRGRASEGFTYIKAWIDYLRDRFSQYVQMQEFTNGIAALIKDKKESKLDAMLERPRKDKRGK